LCAELLAEIDAKAWGIRSLPLSDAIDRARAALAQPEPVELPQGYIDPEHSGLDRQMLETFYLACRAEGGAADEIHLRGLKAVLAGAALAQPEPVGLTDEELREMWLSQEWFNEGATFREFASIVRRWGRPTLTPIPVSDRPWEHEGFCDTEGRCWMLGKVEGDWRLISANNSGVPKLSYCFSHCLPHYALPLPAAPGEGE
jgi:hypothetical protein